MFSETKIYSFVHFTQKNLNTCLIALFKLLNTKICGSSNKIICLQPRNLVEFNTLFNIKKF